MTEAKLKPCPFCGGEATLIYADDKTWQVVCDSCGSCSDYYDEEWNPDNPPEGNEAASAWNNRMIEDEKDEEIKRFREALETIKEMANDMSANGATIYDLISIRNICCDALEGWKE